MKIWLVMTAMNEAFKGFSGFWRGLVSEKDGTPSSARFLMLLLGIVGSVVVLVLAFTIRNADVAKTALILSGLPAILAALALWQTSGYMTNRLASKKTEQIEAQKSYAPGGPVEPKA